MTLRSPTNSDGCAIGCLGCTFYIIATAASLAFVAAVVWVVVLILKWQGVL